MRLRISMALTIAAVTLAASAQTSVIQWGRAASCRAASLAENAQNLSGFELLFSTVLTRVEPGLRRSALVALGQRRACRRYSASGRPAGSTPTCAMRETSPGAHTSPRAGLRSRSLV